MEVLLCERVNDLPHMTMKEAVTNVTDTRDVVAKLLDCDIVVSELDIQSSHFVHFSTNKFGIDMNTLFSMAMG